MTVIDSQAPWRIPTPREPSTAPHRVQAGLLDPRMLWRASPDAVRKLDPRTMWKNPVMFVVEIGAVFTTVEAITKPSVFAWLIVVWLWLTAVFANLAEAVAEGRGKAQAESLRRAKTDTVARRLIAGKFGSDHVGPEELIPAPQLMLDDIVVCEASPATATSSTGWHRWTRVRSPVRAPR